MSKKPITRSQAQLARRCERTADRTADRTARTLATPGPEAVRRTLGGTLDSTEPTPERELILQECLGLLERYPTRDLIAMLKVLARHGSIDSQLRVIASKDKGDE